MLHVQIEQHVKFCSILFDISLGVIVGIVCQCCIFNLEKTWGEHGKGFIHVHHIRPLRTLGPDYQIDPVNELVPLCPNCHAMIHRGNEAKPLSVEELRAMMRPAG